MISIPFTEFLPDQPALGQSGLLEVKNAVPRPKGYSAFRDIAPFTNPISSKALGSFWMQDQAGLIYFFAGDQGNLYRLLGNGFSDISNPSGYNANRWEFVKWGSRCIATNINNVVQYYDIGSSTTFLDLPGTPPQAKHIGVVRDFVVLGNIQGFPSRIQWSGFNNSELWTPSAATQSGLQDLLGNGGDVQKIVPGNVGVIFQEQSIQIMAYAGPGPLFSFDEIEDSRGTPAPQSVCWTGQQIYFLSHDGFYTMNRNGGAASPLGAARIDQTFQDDVNTEFYDQIIGVVDRRNRLVLWAYCSKSSAGTPDRLLIYDWINNKYAFCTVDIQYMGEWLSPTYSLDDLDTILADIDSESINVDSEAFQGGRLGLAIFDNANRLGFFEGDPIVGEYTTGDVGSGEIAISNRVRPNIEGAATSQLLVGTKNSQSDNTVWSLPKNVKRTGEFHFRSRARFHRYKLLVSGDYDFAVGLDTYLQPAGER